METTEVKKPVLLIISIVAGAGVLLVSIFRWYLVEALTVFLEPMLEFLVFAVFLAVLFSSFVYFVFNVQKIRLKACYPLAVCSLVLVIVLFVPFTEIMLDLDYRINYSQRNKVVNMIKTGEIGSNGTGLIQLPDKYKHLSKGGGEIVVKRDGDSLRVFFYTFRGILDNFSGFVYDSDASDFYGDYQQIIRKNDHWFWATSY